MKIIVKVSDLLAKAQSLADSQMEYVELLPLDPQAFDGETIPANLSFTAIKSKESLASVDFEDIEIMTDIEI